METISLNSKTLIIKADKESDISELIDFVAKKNKPSSIDALLSFASQNRVVKSGYAFNRDDCYDR